MTEIDREEFENVLAERDYAEAQVTAVRKVLTRWHETAWYRPDIREAHAMIESALGAKATHEFDNNFGLCASMEPGYFCGRVEEDPIHGDAE